MYLPGISVRRRQDITKALWSPRVSHIAGTRWGTGRYLNMNRLEEQDDKALLAVG